MSIGNKLSMVAALSIAATSGGNVSGWSDSSIKAYSLSGGTGNPNGKPVKRKNDIKRKLKLSEKSRRKNRNKK